MQCVFIKTGRLVFGLKNITKKTLNYIFELLLMLLTNL